MTNVQRLHIQDVVVPPRVVRMGEGATTKGGLSIQTRDPDVPNNLWARNVPPDIWFQDDPSQVRVMFESSSSRALGEER